MTAPDPADHIGLACALARRRSRRWRHMDPGDLEGEAKLALVEACERFDPSRGFRFSTYASSVIGRRLDEYALESSSMIRVPGRIRRQWHATGQDRTPPQTPALTDTMVLTVGNGETDPADQVVSAAVAAEARALLLRLGDFDRRVVVTRFGFDGNGPETLAATARRLGVTVAEVARAEADALIALRAAAAVD